MSYHIAVGQGLELGPNDPELSISRFLGDITIDGKVLTPAEFDIVEFEEREFYSLYDVLPVIGVTTLLREDIKPVQDNIINLYYEKLADNAVEHTTAEKNELVDMNNLIMLLAYANAGDIGGIVVITPSD